MTTGAPKLTLTIVIVLLGVFFQAASAHAADPFYEEQMRRGKRAYELGNYKDASRALRIAAFGLLEEPVVLAEALVFLGLSDAARDDRAAFDSTFERIVEIEERFSAYSSLTLPEAKSAFEGVVLEWVPPAHLRITPVFAALLEERARDEDTAAKPPARRRSLRKLLKQNPNDFALRLELARIELESGREAKALAEIDRALALDPTSTEAHCLRVGISTASRQCEPAQASVPFCPGSAAASPTDAFLLGCLVDRERWTEARGLLEALTEERRATAAISPLESRVTEYLASSSEPPIGESAEAAETVAASVTSSEPESEPALSTLDRVTATRIRKLVDSATQPSELEEPTRLAFDLANRNLQSREAQLLAGEVAYRGGRWSEAVEWFRRAGGPTTREPLLLFYFAVALFESGEPEAAASHLRSALPGLSRTDFVDDYARRILAE